MGAPGAGGGGGRRRMHSLAEINVTPLVDVMLVLLIISMLAAPMLQKGIPLELPRTETSQDIPEARITETCHVPVVVQSVKLSPFIVPEILVVQKQETDYLGEEYAPSEQFSLTSKSKSRTLRVDYQKLDDIVNIIGELIIGGSTMARSLTEVRDYIATDQQSARLMDHLEKTSANIRKNLLNLQENVMKVRMTPIDVVFRKFPRVVRDLALKSGKEVTLHMRGEGTDLDKTLVDVIDEPLYHLIKNTIDHGKGCCERIRGKDNNNI